MGEERFEVTVEVQDGAVTVVVRDGDVATTATVRSSAEAEPQPHIPIGTRDAARLAMQVDGSPVELAPGPGRYTRWSYHVIAILDGATYVLLPCDGQSSRLTRDSRWLGDLTRTESTLVTAQWEPDAEVHSVDAALGYALAAAFGTGSRTLLGMLLESLVGIAERAT